MSLCLFHSFDARALLEPLLVVEESGGEEPKLVHGPANVVVHLLAVSAETLVRVEEGGGLDHETVLPGGELLAGGEALRPSMRVTRGLSLSALNADMYSP